MYIIQNKSGGVTLNSNPLASFPVGSIFISVKDISPAQIFGGSWRLLEEGYALWTTKTTGQGGQFIEAGLPNIKGTVGRCITGSQREQITIATGAFTESYIENCYAAHSYKDERYAIYSVFNASKYNQIFNDSVATVQPPAIKIFAWERIEN